MSRPFQLVDVFGIRAFTGNPVAVVADAAGLDTDTMQRITRWLNLSESTFLLPPTDPQADYQVRIFTLDRELPFAGHPTLGTCHAWLATGGVPKQADRIVQQCGAGLIPIRRIEDRLAFAAPPTIRSGPVEEEKLAEIADILRVDRAAFVASQWVDNGPGWVAVMLESAAAVLAVAPAGSHPTRVEIGLVGAHPAGADVDFELRAIFSDPHGRLIEDPVTGSLNASVAQWLIGSGRAGPSYRAAQGTSLGRSGRIHVEQDGDGAIWIGGRAETLFSGRTAF